jgi:thioredoxin-like negative regulator of GroEL
MEEAFTRSLVALGIIGVGTLAYCAWNRYCLFRLKRGVRRPGLENWQSGTPGILYFTTPECTPCRTMQRPALARLQTEFGAPFQIIEIDASVHGNIADHWGVFSVPTTFVLNASGEPVAVNHGVANASKLKQQLTQNQKQADNITVVTHPARITENL